MHLHWNAIDTGSLQCNDIVFDRFILHAWHMHVIVYESDLIHTDLLVSRYIWSN